MDYPSNSNKSRETVDKEPLSKRPAKPEKKVEKVTTGEVIQRKPSLGKRFKETFGGGDARGVWSYVVLDVLVPAAKDMFVDATSEGVQRMLFGDNRGGRHGRNRGRGNGYVNYNRYGSGSRPPWGERDRDDRRTLSQRSRASHDFDEIVLEDRGDAEGVVDGLAELISVYGTATVADLYQLVGVEQSHTDTKWGWQDFRGAGITRVKGGYLLDLPRPEPLD